MEQRGGLGISGTGTKVLDREVASQLGQEAACQQDKVGVHQPGLRVWGTFLAITVDKIRII